MEQLPIFKDGATLQAPTTTATSANPLGTSLNGSNSSNQTPFADIANKLMAESNKPIQAKLGLTVGFSKIQFDILNPNADILVQDLPLDGNPLPYGNDALELIPIIPSENEVKLTSKIPSEDLQARLQQIMLGSKHDFTKESVKIDANKTQPIDVSAKSLTVDLESAAINQKQNLLLQQSSQKFDKAMAFQQQKGAQEESMLAMSLGDTIKKLVKNNASALLTDSSKTQKSSASAIDQLQNLNNLGSVSRPEVNQNNISSNVPKITQSINHPQWGKELANRVVFISKQNMGEAKIRINPANLGPIELRVSVQNDQASISFISNHALVREAIENSMPRLKEMFEANGFSSLDVNISDNSHADKEDKESEKLKAKHENGSELDLDNLGNELIENIQQARSATSLIDFFA